MFNGDVSKWKTSAAMFMGRSKLSSGVDNFCSKYQLTASSVFHYAAQFNGDLSKWDTSTVTTMNASKLAR